MGMQRGGYRGGQRGRGGNESSGFDQQENNFDGGETLAALGDSNNM